nr:hypothetical protein Iba_scaffold7281CG0340 [Ipomoea batatas]
MELFHLQEQVWFHGIFARFLEQPINNLVRHPQMQRKHQQTKPPPTAYYSILQHIHH